MKILFKREPSVVTKIVFKLTYHKIKYTMYLKNVWKYIKQEEADTINVLLNCDERQKTIHERVQSGNAHETMKSIMNEVDGMTPLHLAATHDDSKVVALLLKADTEKSYESTLFIRDHKQRIPLHVACAKDATDEIVEQPF